MGVPRKPVARNDRGEMGGKPCKWESGRWTGMHTSWVRAKFSWCKISSYNCCARFRGEGSGGTHGSSGGAAAVSPRRCIGTMAYISISAHTSYFRCLCPHRKPLGPSELKCGVGLCTQPTVSAPVTGHRPLAGFRRRCPGVIAALRYLVIFWFVESWAGSLPYFRH